MSLWPHRGSSQPPFQTCIPAVVFSFLSYGVRGGSQEWSDFLASIRWLSDPLQTSILADFGSGLALASRVTGVK